MPHSTTLYDGMAGRNESIAVAYAAQGHGAEVIDLGAVGTRRCDLAKRIRQPHAFVRRAVEKLASIGLPLGDENPLCLWIRPVAGGVTALHHHITATNGLQHHGKLVLVVPPQPMHAQLRLHQASLLEDLMTHPDVLHLLDTVGHGGLVGEDGGAVGGAPPRAPYTPLPLDLKVAPGHGQSDEEFPARFEMPMKSS